VDRPTSCQSERVLLTVERESRPSDLGKRECGARARNHVAADGLGRLDLGKDSRLRVVVEVAAAWKVGPPLGRQRRLRVLSKEAVARLAPEPPGRMWIGARSNRLVEREYLPLPVQEIEASAARSVIPRAPATLRGRR
jgi:hypothetical protein